MKTPNHREELHEYLTIADERFIEMVYAMMRVEKEHAIITDEEEHELELRKAAHTSGKSKSLTWAETKARVLGQV